MEVKNINFKAEPIKPVVIQRFNKNAQRFMPENAYVVKLDAKNRMDIRAIDINAKKWRDATYIKQIATSSHWMNNVPIEIYALTTQQKNFEKLKPNLVLGYVEMRNDDNFPQYKQLYRLQVNPKAINVNNTDNKRYKYVGTSILNTLKKIYKNISLFSKDSPNVIAFYKKNDFIEDYYGRNHFVWSSNIFRRYKVHIDKFRLKYGL